jgi:predicted LPLAT superfamily acyltransferase
MNETFHKIEAKKRGNALGFWFFKTTLKLFGLSGAYGLLYGVALHYALFDKPARAGALAYIKRRFPGSSGMVNFVHTYRLFINQGKQLIDRFACISGQVEFDMRLEGYDELMKLVAGGKGFVLLTSHTGNWQIAMTALSKIDKPVYLVMRPEDNRAVSESLKIGADNNRIKIISPEQYLGGVVEIMNALSAGAIVAIMGDRRYGFDGIDVQFLGKPALLPYGAFVIAANARCPVVVLESAKLGPRRYDVNVTHTIQPRLERGRDKKEQLRVFVQEYSNILESFVKKYPYQCFLFHDIWQAQMIAD